MKTTKYIVLVGEFDADLDCMDWQEYEYDTRAEQLIAADRLQTKKNRVKLSERTTEQMDDGYKCLTINGGMIFEQLN
jgi:hypothetical protein